MPRPSCKKRAEQAGAKGEMVDKICIAGIDQVCKQFRADPTTNPLTGRSIAADGPIFKVFEALCGAPAAAEGPRTPVARPPVPVPHITESDMDRIKTRVILSIRDEMIVKVSNAIREQVKAEVTDGLKDEIKQHVMTELKKVILHMIQESVAAAVKALPAASGPGPALPSSASEGAQTQTLPKGVKAQLLADIKTEINGLEKQVLAKLEQNVETMVHGIVEPRIKRFEDQVDRFTNTKLPDSLVGKKIIFYDVANADANSLTDNIQKAQGIVLKKDSATVCDIAVIKDKSTKLPPNARAGIVMTLQDFKDYYFPYLPRCRSDNMFKSTTVAFQPGYVNGKIKKYVEKCGGVVVPPTVPDLGILVTNSLNPSIEGAFIGSDTLVFTADEFYSRYMYRCKQNGLSGKTVALYGFRDEALRDHVNHCNCKFIDDAESIKVSEFNVPIDFIVYRGVEGDEPQTRANRASALKVDFVKNQVDKHNCKLVEYAAFYKEFINVANDVFQKRVAFQVGYTNAQIVKYVEQHDGVVVTDKKDEVDFFITNPRKPLKGEWVPQFRMAPGGVRATATEFMLKYMFNCSYRDDAAAPGGGRVTLDRKRVLLHKLAAEANVQAQLQSKLANCANVLISTNAPASLSALPSPNYDYIIHDGASDAAKDRVIDAMVAKGAALMDVHEFVEVFSSVRITKAAAAAAAASAQAKAKCTTLANKGVALFDCAGDATLVKEIEACSGAVVDFKRATKAIDVVVYQHVTQTALLENPAVKKLLADNKKTVLVSRAEFEAKFLGRAAGPSAAAAALACEGSEFLVGKNVGFYNMAAAPGADELKAQTAKCGANVVDAANIPLLDFLVYSSAAAAPPPPAFIKDALDANPDLEIVNDDDFYKIYINGADKRILNASKQRPFECLTNSLLKNKVVAFYSHNDRLAAKVEKCSGIVTRLNYDDNKTRLDYIIYKAGDEDIIKNDPYIKDYLAKPVAAKLMCISEVDFTAHLVNGAKKTWASLPGRLLFGKKKNPHPHFF